MFQQNDSSLYKVLYYAWVTCDYTGHKAATDCDELGSAQDLEPRRHHGELNPAEGDLDWTRTEERP